MCPLSLANYLLKLMLICLKVKHTSLLCESTNYEQNVMSLWIKVIKLLLTFYNYYMGRWGRLIQEQLSPLELSF